MSKIERNIIILSEDESLVAVNKPAGILSIPDRFRPELLNLRGFLEKTRETIIPIHRLDKYTSGIILFAKTTAAHRSMSMQFQNRTIDKKYWAITQGIPSPTEGTIDRPIAADPSNAGKMKINRNGKVAISHYRLLETFQQIALVEIKIDTGRTHQIRVHLKSIGTPLLVDKDYAKKESWFLSSFKGKKFNAGKFEEEKPLLSRLSLHAKELTFKHPDNGEQITLEAELPKDLRATLRQLEKWNRNKN